MVSSRILLGDVVQQLRALPDQSVHCAITSPPYWNLRDYQIEGQIGLEPTLSEYLERLTTVFSELARVLRNDGTFWLNIGDSYAGGGCGARDPERWPKQSRNDHMPRHAKKHGGLKDKDLMMVPARVAIAVQESGWYLRSVIIWEKNAMPESVEDRPTNVHEYVYLFSKEETYFYDHFAILEEVSGTAHGRGTGKNPKTVKAGFKTKQNASFSAVVTGLVEQRNARSVWYIPTQPYPGAHFATFPEELARRCMFAGTSERGVCGRCDAPYERIVKTRRLLDGVPVDDLPPAKNKDSAEPSTAQGVGHGRISTIREHVGWKPGCKCGEGPLSESAPIVPATVLDPFCGSGTTGAVAAKHGRNFIGCELNPDYVRMAEKRIYEANPLFVRRGA